MMTQINTYITKTFITLEHNDDTNKHIYHKDFYNLRA